MSKTFPVVFHTLEQVLKTLTTSEVAKSREVSQLLKIGVNNGILDGKTLGPKPRALSVVKPKLPFIVIEGLDGSGKTRVCSHLCENLDCDLLSTPPDGQSGIKHLKEFFDSYPECIRRAFYAFGNYIAASLVSRSKFQHGLIMDRYHHSTASSALAHLLSSHLEPTLKDYEWPPTLKDYEWPSDLLKPDVVLFLVVSEETRKYRHKIRGTTNTKEEQLLATNGIFRQNLIDSYLQIKGVPLIQFDANEDIEVVKTKSLLKVTELFPILTRKGLGDDEEEKKRKV